MLKSILHKVKINTNLGLEKLDVQLFLQIAGVLVVIFNVWITSKLAPVAQNIQSVATRVNAIEETLRDGKTLLERFYVLEERNKEMNEQQMEIKAQLQRLEDKIDSLKERK